MAFTRTTGANNSIHSRRTLVQSAAMNTFTEIQEAFLTHYTRNGVVQTALDHVKQPRSILKEWRNNKDFLEALNEARDASVELAEGELRRRGVGYEETLIVQGSVIYQRDPATGELALDDDFNPIPLTVKKHSDRLLEAYLKANDDKYKDKSKIEHVGHDGGAIKSEIVVKYRLPDGETADDCEG